MSTHNPVSCVNWSPLPCNNHYDYEIFTPPYLLDDNDSDAPRPEIRSASAIVPLGGLVTVTTTVPCTSFALMRLAVVTHTISNDLRRVVPEIETAVGLEYSLRVTDNGNVATPGLYWLFAMDEKGVPSTGWNIQVVKD